VVDASNVTITFNAIRATVGAIQFGGSVVPYAANISFNIVSDLSMNKHQATDT